MKHYFYIFFSILFSCYLYQVKATELADTNKLGVKEYTKLYQLDIILFYYTDLSLENMTPRILPLHKDFTANKIISLSSRDHPLNQIAKEYSTKATNVNADTEKTEKAVADISAIKPDILPNKVSVNTESGLQSTVAVSDEALTDQQVLVAQTVNFDETNNYNDATLTKTDSEPSTVNFINAENKDNTNCYLIQKNVNADLVLDKLNIKQDTTILNIDNNINKIVINEPVEEQSSIIATANSETSIDNNAIKNSKDQEIENILATTAFIELPEDNYLLKTEFNKILANKNMNLIAYNCWKMPIDKTTKVVLEPTSTSGSFKQFKAEISCKKNNLGKILITTNIYFNLSVAELKQLNQNNKIIEYKKKHKYYDPYLYSFFSYEFHTNIKNSEKLIYLDSPVIGILLKITPLN